MANINSKWTKFAVVGCNHGHLGHAGVIESALKFWDDFKPERRIHAGDNFDTAPWRTKAIGTPDETVPIAPDMNAGLEFLELFRFTDYLLGNHCIRLWRNRAHHNAVVAECARKLIEDIHALCDRIGCTIFEKYTVRDPGIRLADTLVMHGFANGMYASKKNANTYGRCIHAHNHSVGQAIGDRDDHPTAYCIGSLADFDKLEYSLTNLGSLRQSHGLGFGEYNDKECKVWLAEPGKDGTFRMPL